MTLPFPLSPRVDSQDSSCTFIQIRFRVRLSSPVRVFVKVFDVSFVSDNGADQEPKAPEVAVGHKSLRSRYSPLIIESTAEINAKDFVAEVFVEPEVVRFLGMRTTGACRHLPSSNEDGGLTLRMALHKLAVGVDAEATPRDERDTRLSAERRQGGWNFVRWEDVESLLFDPLDPAREVLGSPPLTASIASPTSLPAGTVEEEVRGVGVID